MNRSDILAQADELITETRHDQHGDASTQFHRIAGRWGNVLGVDIRAEEVILMMIDLKIVRTLNSPRLADNWRDIIGYAALGAEIAGAED